MANYILEIEKLDGDEVGVMLYDDHNNILESLWCIIAVDASGAHIIDNGYRSFAEIRAAWPDAIGEPDTFRCDLCGKLLRLGGVECECKAGEQVRNYRIEAVDGSVLYDGPDVVMAARFFRDNQYSVGLQDDCPYPFAR